MKQNKYHYISCRIYFYKKKLFRDINANIIFYKLCQTCASLTGTFPIITFFSGRREYYLETKTTSKLLYTGSTELIDPTHTYFGVASTRMHAHQERDSLLMCTYHGVHPPVHMRRTRSLNDKIYFLSHY